MDADLATLPDAPIKIISMGVFCLNSYSMMDCLQAPQGGIGTTVLSLDAVAEIANFNICVSGNFAQA